MIVAMSMFMLFQTIPILVRSPEPDGFAGNAVNAANILAVCYNNIIIWPYIGLHNIEGGISEANHCRHYDHLNRLHQSIDLSF
jgi:hypothetical protein